MSQQSNRYIFGTSTEELERLGMQHQTWASEAASIWSRAEFTRGSALVDVGCGPGYASIELARLVGSEGRVLAIDNSEHFLEYLQASAKATGLDHLEILNADIRNLNLPKCTYDGAFARWVLSVVKEPERVIDHLSSTLKTGGRLVIQDYYNVKSARLLPPSTLLAEVFDALFISWCSTGANPNIGEELPRILQERGFKIIHLQDLNRIAQSRSQIWWWIDSFWRVQLNRLVDGKFLKVDTAKEFLAEWSARTENQNNYYSQAMMLEIIAEKI